MGGCKGDFKDRTRERVKRTRSHKSSNPRPNTSAPPAPRAAGPRLGEVQMPFVAERRRGFRTLCSRNLVLPRMSRKRGLDVRPQLGARGVRAGCFQVARLLEMVGFCRPGRGESGRAGAEHAAPRVAVEIEAAGA